jgi:predicted nucleic acid-binding protein
MKPDMAAGPTDRQAENENPKRVYLDNCAYNRPFDDQSRMRIFLEAQAKIYIQRLIVDGNLRLAYSYMSVYENNDNPDPDHRAIIADFFKYAEVVVDYDRMDDVEHLAERVTDMRIKADDALHIACAIIAKCDYFITTDDTILKRYCGHDIGVCTPVQFLDVLEENDA